MTLTREMRDERLATLIKTYIIVKRHATARQVTDFINSNRFGLSVSSREIENYLKNNVHRDYKSGRGCLRNCYGYRQDGRKARVYHIHE